MESCQQHRQPRKPEPHREPKAEKAGGLLTPPPPMRGPATTGSGAVHATSSNSAVIAATRRCAGKTVRQYIVAILIQFLLIWLARVS